MAKKKGKGGKRMETEEAYNYGPPQSSGVKKKRLVKLTRKQKLRKSKKLERGEALVDQRSKKIEKDARRLDKRLAAKAMW
jgi:hypothetical protein